MSFELFSAKKNWEATTLGEAARRGGGDIQTGPFGSQLHASDYVESGIPVIMPQNIGDNRINPTDIAQISNSDANRLARHLVKKGDIVYSRRGDVEKRALIRDGEAGWFCGTGCLRIRFGEGAIIPEYASFYLNHPMVRAWIVKHAQGATMPNLNTSILSDVPFLLPPYNEQRTIATTLSALEDKIVNNTAINHHLEQMAQAIFKSWFVDFRPWGGAQPSNWRKGTISDLGDVIGGSTPSKAKPEFYTEHGIAWVTPKDLSLNKSKFVAHGADDITELGLRNSSARLMPRGTVLFSSRAPIGYIAIASGEVCTNQGFKSVVPKANVGTAFIYYFLIENLQTIEGMASGSTFKEVSGSTMKGIPAIIPDDNTLRRFQEECTPIFEKQELLEAENVRLTEIRDSLLPRLMSGELSGADLGDAK
jgi:type I restriction enzyme S subunit